jgi:CelD/BcsL family acetyltransferase involved in cellulose biosynthesis
MTVKIVQSEEEFSALERVWDELFNANPNHTPYQSWQWNATWWRHFGVSGELRVLLVEEEGRVIGIAPLRVKRRLYGFPFRHLELISGKRADYLDFLVMPGYETAFIHQAMDALNNCGESHFLEIRDFRESSSNVSALVTQALARSRILSLRVSETCVAVPLTQSWETFLGTVSKRTRTHIGYDRRLLNKSFATELKVYTTLPDALTGLDDLIAVYRSRWTRELGASYFDDQKNFAFERDVCERFVAIGGYRLYVLYADRKPVAALSGFERNRVYYAQLFTHSPDFHKYSVGNVLLGMAIEDCIQRSCTSLDLMRGDEAYKFRWNGQPTRNLQLRAFRSRGALLCVSFADWAYERACSIGLLHRLRAGYRRWRHGRKVELTASPAAVNRSSSRAFAGARSTGTFSRKATLASIISAVALAAYLVFPLGEPSPFPEGMDADGDRAVSLNEWLDFHRKTPRFYGGYDDAGPIPKDSDTYYEREFERVDCNHDMRLDPAEFHALRSNMKWCGAPP